MPTLRGYSLHQVQQEERPCSSASTGEARACPVNSSLWHKTPTCLEDRSQPNTSGSKASTASELSVKKCPPPSLKLPSCFFHQRPQNQLFPTPCFIWEYYPTDTRGVYLNLTSGVESLLETINWFEFGGTSYLHQHVSRTIPWRSVTLYPRTHTASAERRSMSTQSPQVLLFDSAERTEGGCCIFLDGLTKTFQF